ncbi:MAG: ERAP1-like C-terminal domain-containing protein [Myxococcales bacterium]|nr:ERAP1-like C-terminal domain-containing protein [Myxococcales bacterium]
MARTSLVAVALVSMVVGCGGGHPAAAPARPPSPGPVGPAPAIDPPAIDPLAVAPVAPADVRLPRAFRVESYAPSLVIDPAQPTFTGSIAIAGTLAAGTPAVWLHAERLTIDSAVATTATGDVPLRVWTDRAPGRVALTAAAPLPAGHVVITLRYRGALDEVDTAGTFRQQVAGAWYAFTQHEALYARRTFPCVDEPDAKVPWTLTLEVPAALVAASNAPIVSEEARGATRVVRFAATPPLPSYLVAFAVGPFDVVDAGTTRAGVPLRILALAGRAADAAFAARVTAPLVAGLEDWFGSAYPFAKLDAVAIPTTVGFGAMENPGLITYRESLLLMPADAPASRQRAYVGVGTHELAHQWFGDLVTPVWWDDLWLNESFASWLPAKVIAKVLPQFVQPLDAIEGRNSALDADSLATARRIRQPIASEDDILTAFDGITYGKGAAVLRMFDAYVGPERFQAGVRAYLAAHAGGNATAADFLAAIAAQAPELDVTAAMSSLLDQAGAPRVTATIDCAPGRAAVVLTQARYLPVGAAASTTQPVWRLPVCVLAEIGGARARQCTTLGAEPAVVEFARCPTWAWPNADGLGYYRGGVPAAAWPTLLAAAPRLDPAPRLALMSDLLAAVAAGDVDLGVVLPALPALVKRGTPPEQVLAARLVDGARPWVPAADRARFARWVARTFAGARGLGLTPRADEDTVRERLRGELVPLLAETGGDPALRKAAVAAAADWRRLPLATRAMVLWLAVRADPAIHDGLLAAFRAEPDRVARRDLTRALGGVADPARLGAALALTLDPAIDVRDAVEIIYVATSREDTRPVAEAFVRAHADELLARLPVQSRAGMIGWLTSGCDPASVADAQAFAEAKLAALPGARRRIDQSLERLRQCVARRALIEPAVAAWAHRL